MAGGTFTTQNKVRAGVYVNLKGVPNTTIGIADRGTLAVVTSAGWGPYGQVREVLSSEWAQRSREFTGEAPSNIDPFTLAMSKVQKMYFVRIGNPLSDKAGVTAGGVTATALYGGELGNRLSIEVITVLSGGFEVRTYFDNEIVDAQQVATGATLQSNQYVTLIGTTLTAVVKTALTGGEDEVPSATEFGNALSALEGYQFNILASDTTNDTFKALLSAYVTRNRDEAGKNFQVVTGSYPTVDKYLYIPVKNGIAIGEDQLGAEKFAIIYGAMRAGAGINQSLTYATIEGATDASPRLSNAETEQAILNGEIVATYDIDRVVIEADINSQKTFGQEINQSFRKNRVIAVLNAISTDIPNQFRRQFIGKVDANRNGIDLVKASVISYMTELENINAIQNFNPATDITVEIGLSSDSIVITIYVQPVDSIEKIYMTVEVR